MIAAHKTSKASEHELSFPPGMRERRGGVCTTKCGIKAIQRGGLLAHSHVRWWRLLSSRPVTGVSTGRSLEAETYAIQHAWSAVQLVALVHSSGRGKTHTVCSKAPHTAYLRAGASGSLSSTSKFAVLASKFEYGARGR